MTTSKQRLTRISAILLSMVLLFGILSCAPFTVSAAQSNGFVYDISEDNKGIITGYNGSNTSVNIPSSINGVDIIGIDNNAFKGKSKITSISMSNNVIYIGDNAFQDCINLKELNLSRNIFLLGIDSFKNTAFYNNPDNWTDGMLYIDLAQNSYLIGVNVNRTIYQIKMGTTVIAGGVFKNNERLKYCTFPDTLISIGDYAFYQTNLQSEINLPANFMVIGDCAFYDTSISKLTLPKGLKVIGDEVFARSNVSEVNLPSDMEYIPSRMFEDCRKLISIKIPETVKYIDTGAFCSAALEEITIPKSVEYIAPWAFNESELRKINLPDKYIEISASAFRQTYFSNDDSNWKNNGLYVGNYLIDAEYAIDTLKIAEGTKYVVAEICEGNGSLGSVTIPESVEYIGTAAFIDCESLNSVTIPATVKYIGTFAFGVISYGDEYYLKSPFQIKCIKNSAAYKYAKNLGIKIVDVSKATSVKLNRSTLTLGVGEAYTLIKTVTPTVAGSACKWSSSNSTVASVNSKGTVTAKKAGTATITVKTANGLSKTCKVTVKPAPSSIKVSTSSLTLGKGEEFIISESTNAGSYAWKFNWSSSNTSVATVTKTTGNKAEIVAKGTGTANITVKTYNGKTATCKVTVKPAPSSVKLSTTSLTLGKGETFIISQNSNSGSYAKSFSWSSSNSSVATVNKTSGNKAKITAKNNGTATITFKTYNGKTATCKVTVKNAPTSVKTNPASVTLGVGETYTVSESTNSGSYANADNLKWSSTNTAVATVKKGSGNKAQIVAKGVGTAYVKITLYNGKTAQCKVTVKPAPSSVKLSKSEVMLQSGEELIISESTNSGTYANAANLKWESSDTSVATITKLNGNKAKITAVGDGTATVILKLYNGKTAQCIVSVGKIEQATERVDATAAVEPIATEPQPIV